MSARASDDHAAPAPQLRVFSDSSGTLATFLFHGVFRNQAELAREVVMPQQQITVAHFAQFVESLLERGYQFVSPADLANLHDGRYVMATFDDGYFSNLHVLPILEEFRIPAVFFISTGHVVEGRSYWWDVLYRERRRRGATSKQISNEARSLKSLTHDQIEARLTGEFGDRSLVPVNDIDRPLSPAELAEMARSPYVHLGNHTRNHAILTNYGLDEVRSQLVGAQDDLVRMTGSSPDIVSYPNGNHSAQVLQIASEVGFNWGITVERQANTLPLEPANHGHLRLGRYVVWGTRDIPLQLDDLMGPSWWRTIRNRFSRRRAA